MRMKLTRISHWGAAPNPFLFWFFCGEAAKKPYAQKSRTKWGPGGRSPPENPFVVVFFDEVEKIPQQTGLVLCTRENTYQR
jgi:hypothetical protein